MRQKAKIKLIIFDLGGVLVHEGYLDFIKNYCAACLTPRGRRKILALERAANLGRISETEFYREIEGVFGLHLTPRQMHRLIAHRMRRNKALLHLVPNIGPARVALFTNSIGQMALEVLRLYRIPAKKLFQRVFLSSQLHLVKPDAKAYHYILRRMRVRPAEALMVDDRLKNIRGARRIGMAGIIYKNIKQFRKAIRKYEFV